MDATVRVFAIYEPNDEKLFQELQKHTAPLRRQKLMTLDFARAGEMAEESLKGKDVLLLLVTANLIGSDRAYEQVELAMESQKVGVRVIPILLSPTALRGLAFDKLAPLPRGGKSVSEWRQSDAAWVDVVQGIRDVVEALKAKKTEKTP